MCSIVPLLGQHDANMNSGILPSKRRCLSHPAEGVWKIYRGLQNYTETHLGRWATVQFVQQESSAKNSLSLKLEVTYMYWQHHIYSHS
jgi:hypothetical protein